MLLADTLSWAYLEDEPPLEELGEDLICAINQVISNPPVSDDKLIWQAMESGLVMLKLQDNLKCRLAYQLVRPYGLLKGVK